MTILTDEQIKHIIYMIELDRGVDPYRIWTTPDEELLIEEIKDYIESSNHVHSKIRAQRHDG